jgi:hypothetical protein
LFKNTLQIFAAQTLLFLGIKNLNLAFGGVFLFKKFNAALICLTLIMTPTVFSTPVEASPPIGIGPLWLYTDGVSLGMSYSNPTVSWYGIITGGPQCYSILATYRLYRMNAQGQYDQVQAIYLPTYYGRSLYYSDTYGGGPGTYKLTVDAVVTSTTGGSETIQRELVKTFT